jgi:hypothetical protein
MNPQDDRDAVQRPLRVIEFGSFFGRPRSFRRQTRIVPGCLGPHNPSLRVGDIQYLLFQEGDDGPYILSEEERQERRFDSLPDDNAMTYEIRPVHELIDEIVARQQRVGIAERPEALRRKPFYLIAQKCHELDIPLRNGHPAVRPGWVGKAKGMDDLVKERGLLPPDQRQYSPEVYVQLLSTCADFDPIVLIGDGDPSILVPRLLDVPADHRTILLGRMFVGNAAEVYEATDRLLRQLWTEGSRRLMSSRPEGLSSMISAFQLRGFGINDVLIDFSTGHPRNTRRRLDPNPIEREWNRGREIQRQYRDAHDAVDEILNRIQYLRGTYDRTRPATYDIDFEFARSARSSQN